MGFILQFVALGWVHTDLEPKNNTLIDQTKLETPQKKLSFGVFFFIP
jgi:hypothetical protein